MTGIIEIMRDIVARVPDGLEVTLTDQNGKETVSDSLNVNFLFGNAAYVKERLDAYSRGTDANRYKLPLVALFCPVRETRDSSGYLSEARVSLIIACSTRREWSNEQRLRISFQNILRPIYCRLLSELRKDVRLDWDYDGTVPHAYSENYSYGRYGAYDETGKKLTEPIDAINITNLRLRINKLSCRYENNQTMRGCTA